MRTESAVPWTEVSAFVAHALGLHFPPERLTDLQRGIAAAACETGVEDVCAYVSDLLASPPSRSQLDVLAAQLTIGETYFFRDKRMFDALAQSTFAGLINARRGRTQHINIWSAGCCTGEEPYSLAILLHQLIPDLTCWSISILATDLNPRFLAKAAKAEYGEWSFRDAPPELKERYFERTSEKRYTLNDDIRRMVSIRAANLVDESMIVAPGTVDVILCRNVLMYFSATTQRRVAARFHRALGDEGWLVVSPTEVSSAVFASFATRTYPGASFYQKSAGAHAHHPEHAAIPDSVAPPKSRVREARARRRVSAPVVAPAALAPSVAEQARTLADQGRHADAIALVTQWIASDRLNVRAHHLHAMIALEAGDVQATEAALRRALYLDPLFVPAHFALGNLALARRSARDATRHYENAVRGLASHVPEAVMPELDGISVARLRETLADLLTRTGSA